MGDDAEIPDEPSKDDIDLLLNVTFDAAEVLKEGATLAKGHEKRALLGQAARILVMGSRIGTYCQRSN